MAELEKQKKGTREAGRSSVSRLSLVAGEGKLLDQTIRTWCRPARVVDPWLPRTQPWPSKQTRQLQA